MTIKARWRIYETKPWLYQITKSIEDIFVGCCQLHERYFVLIKLCWETNQRQCLGTNVRIDDHIQSTQEAYPDRENITLGFNEAVCQWLLNMPQYWRPLAHEWQSFFKCKQHTFHDPRGPETNTLQWCPTYYMILLYFKAYIIYVTLLWQREMRGNGSLHGTTTQRYMLPYEVLNL